MALFPCHFCVQRSFLLSNYFFFFFFLFSRFLLRNNLFLFHGGTLILIPATSFSLFFYFFGGSLSLTCLTLMKMLQIDKIFKDEASEEKGERARMVSLTCYSCPFFTQLIYILHALIQWLKYTHTHTTYSQDCS